MVNPLELSLRKNYVLSLLLGLSVCFISTASVEAANISLSPSSGAYEVGKSFSVDVRLTNNQDNINAISGLLTFSSDLLQVTGVSKSASIINTWAEEPKYSNQDGTVNVEGIILNPGFSAATGKIISINFIAKSEGTATISLKSGQVLANDGNATNVLGTLGSASITVTSKSEAPSVQVEQPVNSPTSNTTAPEITSSSYPDQNAWYSSKDASFSWKLPAGVSAVRTLYNEKESSTPTKVYDPPINNRSFTADTDGTMYMHVQYKVGSRWGAVGSYRFKIDTQAPENIKVTFPDGPVTTSPTPAILVSAEDKLSGVDHLTMSVDGQDPVTYKLETSGLYRIPKAVSGKHVLLVSVFDQAGNKNDISVDYTIQTISTPSILSYTKHVELGGSLSVTGTTYPQTIVEVALTNDSGKVDSEKIISNEKGEYDLTWNGRISAGVYELRVRAIDQKGAMSEFSDAHIVTMENVALIRVGIFIMNWLSLILILVIAAFSVIAAFWYSLTQFGRFRRKVRRTMLEAENTLKTNVQALRRDTEEFHSILVKAEKKRELTKEEQSILKKFKKRLEITENEIEKKLEAIG